MYQRLLFYREDWQQQMEKRKSFERESTQIVRDRKGSCLFEDGILVETGILYWFFSVVQSCLIFLWLCFVLLLKLFCSCCLSFASRLNASSSLEELFFRLFLTHEDSSLEEGDTFTYLVHEVRDVYEQRMESRVCRTRRRGRRKYAPEHDEEAWCQEKRRKRSTNAHKDRKKIEKEKLNEGGIDDGLRNRWQIRYSVMTVLGH